MRAEDRRFTGKAATNPKESYNIFSTCREAHKRGPFIESCLLGVRMTGITLENARREVIVVGTYERPTLRGKRGVWTQTGPTSLAQRQAAVGHHVHPQVRARA